MSSGYCEPQRRRSHSLTLQTGGEVLVALQLHLALVKLIEKKRER